MKEHSRVLLVIVVKHCADSHKTDEITISQQQQQQQQQQEFISTLGILHYLKGRN